MNTMMKLAAAALGAASIAGGVAVAQDVNSKDPYAHPDTANYGTPPGAPLKRDGSLRADPTPAPVASPMTSDTTSSSTASTSSNTTWNAAPAAAPAPVDTTADTTTTADTSLSPRADRN
jgi:hypothetical protein